MRFYERLTQAVLRRPVELGLTALVGVMGHGGRPPLRHGHIQRVEDEVGPQVGRHRRPISGEKASRNPPGQPGRILRSRPPCGRIIQNCLILVRRHKSHEF